MSPMNNRLLRPTSNYDADALRYINAVQVADGQALEPEVRTAIDAFVRGCKSDSAGYAGDPTRTVWDALQACCIMCGARTISGALVPLVGPAPTAEGAWASGDYDRSTGLKGDGSSLYLNTNRANNADGQDDQHASVFMSALPASSGLQFLLGAGGSETGVTNFGLNISAPNEMFFRSRNVLAITNGQTLAPGLCGVSRSAASGYESIHSKQSFANTQASETPLVRDIHVFRRNFGTGFESDATLGWYSIGSALDLAALDARVSTLIAAIAAALA